MGQTVEGQSGVETADPLDRPLTAPASPAADGEADDLLAQLAGAEIDRMLAEADVEPPAAVVLPFQPTAGKPVAAPVSVELDAVLADASAERSALRTPPPPALGVDDRTDGSAALDLGPAVARVPLALRPLAMLSAPLDAYPATFRDLLGKAAVLTLVNAVAVLAYVLIFRRHH